MSVPFPGTSARSNKKVPRDVAVPIENVPAVSNPTVDKATAPAILVESLPRDAMGPE